MKELEAEGVRTGVLRVAILIEFGVIGGIMN